MRLEMLGAGPQRLDRPLLLGEAQRGRMDCSALGGESNVLGPHLLDPLFAAVPLDGLGRTFALDLPRARAVDGFAFDLKPSAGLT